MLKRDIVLRWTQELAKVIGRLSGLDTGAAMPVLEEAYRALLKVEPERLRELPPEQVLSFLTEEKALNLGQLEFLAELLAREGTLLYESGELVQSRDRLAKALLIFGRVETEQEVFSFERQERMAGLRRRLDEMED